ncbi:hypothetical protein Gpo141_00002792 [Globisporangium polare]
MRPTGQNQFGRSKKSKAFFVLQASIKYEREVLKLRDGGHTSLDWAIEASGPPSKDGKPLQHDSPIVVVLHGLMGCSDAMRSLCAEALAHGYRSVVFNKRGHGGMALATPKLQEFGSVDDLNQAIDRIQELYPASKLSSVGFSAGAGLLSSNLGKMGDAARLDVVVFSSSGFDAHSLFSQGGMHKVDDFLLTLARKNLLYRHEDQLASVIDVPHALRSSSIREFDERVALKMHGYNDHEAYWKNNNPTQGSPLWMLVETEKGSHCTFYEGHVSLKSWVNEVAMQCLNGIRQFPLQTPSQEVGRNTRECAKSVN